MHSLIKLFDHKLLYTIYFLLSQTKKYADVIIPRGADNTGTIHVDLLNTNFISLLSDLGFKITFVCPPLTGCWNRGLILFLSQVIWIQRIREMIFRILMIKISVSNFCQFVEKSGSIVLRWLETYGTVLFIASQQIYW